MTWLVPALAGVYGPEEPVTIGLSDITVNRSQPWHTDLLRGAYARFLTPDMCWGDASRPCIKALLYLRPDRFSAIDEARRQSCAERFRVRVIQNDQDVHVRTLRNPFRFTRVRWPKTVKQRVGLFRRFNIFLVCPGCRQAHWARQNREDFT